MKLVEFFNESLYPSGIKCIVCGGELDRDYRNCVCGKCELPYNKSYCVMCGRAVAEQNFVCDRCKNEEYAFIKARSSFVYRDGAKKLVHRLKYGNAAYLADGMAGFMADTYFSSDITADIVTCVPVHKSRLRARGYNQSKLLAEKLADLIKKPYCDTLVKTVKTRNLTGMGRVQRAETIKGSFGLEMSADIRGKRILLVDDVLTTGATANECARVLAGGGAAEVGVITFASREERPQLI